MLQLSVLEQAARPKFVACDTMNFWISGKRPELLTPARARRHAAAQRRGGAPALRARPTCRRRRARSARWGRARWSSSAATRARCCFTRSGVFAAPAFPIEDVVDPTGAGDSFAGGFMGWLARTGNSRRSRSARAMILGSVLASFCVEDFSLDRFRRLDISQIRERFAAFADLVHFEKIKISGDRLGTLPASIIAVRSVHFGVGGGGGGAAWSGTSPFAGGARVLLRRTLRSGGTWRLVFRLASGLRPEQLHTPRPDGTSSPAALDASAPLRFDGRGCRIGAK